MPRCLQSMVTDAGTLVAIYTEGKNPTIDVQLAGY